MSCGFFRGRCRIWRRWWDSNPHRGILRLAIILLLSNRVYQINTVCFFDRGNLLYCRCIGRLRRLRMCVGSLRFLVYRFYKLRCKFQMQWDANELTRFQPCRKASWKHPNNSHGGQRQVQYGYHHISSKQYCRRPIKAQMYRRGPVFVTSFRKGLLSFEE